MRKEYLWALLTLIVAIILAIVLLLILREDQPVAQVGEPQLYADDIPMSAELLYLDKQALDEAYHDQLKRLFSVWLTSQAPREATQFSNGLRLARRAYIQAAGQIERREKLLEKRP